MEQQFNNMIQVLTYFADQCDMYKPMLDGVQHLKDQNELLKDQLKQSVIIQNRLQLESSFSADYANFGIATVNAASVDKVDVAREQTYKSVSKEDDLYSLIKSVIDIGKDNYNKKDMEYKLDFYSMIEKIDFDKYMELIELIESQHEDETVKEDVEESIPSKEETSKDEENKEEVSTDKENESGETDKDAVNDSSDNKKDEVPTDENKTPTEEEVKVPTTEEVEDKVEPPTVNEVETPIVSEEKTPTVEVEAPIEVVEKAPTEEGKDKVETPTVEKAPTVEVEENKKDNSSSNDKETEKDVTVENNEGSSQDIEKPSNETTSEKSNE